MLRTSLDHSEPGSFSLRWSRCCRRRGRGNDQQLARSTMHETFLDPRCPQPYGLDALFILDCEGWGRWPLSQTMHYYFFFANTTQVHYLTLIQMLGKSVTLSQFYRGRDRSSILEKEENSSTLAWYKQH